MTTSTLKIITTWSHKEETRVAINKDKGRGSLHEPLPKAGAGALEAGFISFGRNNGGEGESKAINSESEIPQLKSNARIKWYPVKHSKEHPERGTDLYRSAYCLLDAFRMKVFWTFQVTSAAGGLVYNRTCHFKLNLFQATQKLPINHQIKWIQVLWLLFHYGFNWFEIAEVP